VRPAIKPIEKAVRMAAIFILKAFPNSFLARTWGPVGVEKVGLWVR
jgi:hypothetical protein